VWLVPPSSPAGLLSGVPSPFESASGPPVSDGVSLGVPLPVPMSPAAVSRAAALVLSLLVGGVALLKPDQRPEFDFS